MEARLVEERLVELSENIILRDDMPKDEVWFLDLDKVFINPEDESEWKD